MRPVLVGDRVMLWRGRNFSSVSPILDSAQHAPATQGDYTPAPPAEAAHSTHQEREAQILGGGAQPNYCVVLAQGGLKDSGGGASIHAAASQTPPDGI